MYTLITNNFGIGEICIIFFFKYVSKYQKI